MWLKNNFYTFAGIIVALSLFLPFGVSAAVDLGVQASDISFSTNSFVVGQRATVYVKVRSYGDQDASGLVNLYINNQLLDAGLAVSVVSSEPDTVYAEFTVPDKNFKISVDLKNVYPAESQLQNNNAITTEQVVDIDIDGDGIGDIKDADDDNDGLSDAEENRLGTNPKKVDTDSDGYGDSNDSFPLDRTEWLDTDHDGIGDNTDNDDDNDGLTDSQEASLKTNPKKADTDGDGWSDKEDAYPLDSSRHTLTVNSPAVVTSEPNKPLPPTPAQPRTETSNSKPKNQASEDKQEPSPATTITDQPEDGLQAIKDDFNKIKNGESLTSESQSIFHFNQLGFWILLGGLFLVMIILLKLRSRATARVTKPKDSLRPDEFAVPSSVQIERQIEASFKQKDNVPRVTTPKSSPKSVHVRVKKIQSKR